MDGEETIHTSLSIPFLASIVFGGLPKAATNTADMIVPVFTDGQKLEYFTIELQGQLEPTHGDVLDGLRIGSLRVEDVRLWPAIVHSNFSRCVWANICTSSQDIPYMIVGGHQLEGKIVDLKKPLAVIQKLPTAAAQGGAAASSQIPASAAVPSTAPSSSQQETQLGGADGEAPAAVYSVVGFVRRKVCFTKRPLPMVQGGVSSLSKRAARGDDFPQPVGIMDA